MSSATSRRADLASHWALSLVLLTGGAANGSAAQSAGSQPDSMHFTIAAPAEVARGEPVPVTLSLTNTADQPVTVYLHGRPTAFDIVITDDAGVEVWRRLKDQTVTAILGLRRLEPDETITFEDTWRQQSSGGGVVPPGRYRLVGVLTTDARTPLSTAPATVLVRP